MHLVYVYRFTVIGTGSIGQRIGPGGEFSEGQYKEYYYVEKNYIRTFIKLYFPSAIL